MKRPPICSVFSFFSTFFPAASASAIWHFHRTLRQKIWDPAFSSRFHRALRCIRRSFSCPCYGRCIHKWHMFLPPAHEKPFRCTRYTLCTSLRSNNRYCNPFRIRLHSSFVHSFPFFTVILAWNFLRILYISDIISIFSGSLYVHRMIPFKFPQQVGLVRITILPDRILHCEKRIPYNVAPDGLIPYQIA